MKKNKMLIMLITISFTTIITLILILLTNKNNEVNVKNISLQEINTYATNTITNREILQNNFENAVLIGYSKKELENNFYDIKIIKKDLNTYTIIINKLWKEQKKEKFQIYQQQYIKELEVLIKRIFDIESKDEIFNFILKGYLDSKEESKNKKTISNIKFKGILLQGKTDKNEYVVKVKGI
ncbi:MAG: hypothetical protein PHR25_00250 [Clostridia bacterium]|nr:hypothetical protein [Clostridia bacterium]MDD4375205.1 hypothetical protein [Clostridia bacterium]